MSDLTGELIDGRYQLIRLKATGGMASIYEALDTRLDRKVAVKIMHGHLAQDEIFVERFIREAKAAASLSHPNIVAVQDQGWNQSGTPAVFIVMELVEGHTLREYLYERGKLSVSDGIKFLLPIVSALSAAHKAGIVHRDIKPENILVSKEGRIKIADFGLAKGQLLGTTMTAESSVILGSVSYLSPEQVQRGVADSRSDVYSVGITAFELFTGRKPYESDEPLHVAMMHVNQRVPRVSTFIPNFPEALDDLIYSATSSDPDERPRDAGVFHSQLQAIGHALDPQRRQMSMELDIPIAPMRPEIKKKSLRKRISEITTPIALPPAPDEKTVPVARESTEQIRKKRRASKRVRRNRKVALIMAISLGVGSWYVLIGPGSKITVPGLVDATQEQVNAALSPLGLTSIVVESLYSEDVPEGHVIKTDPVGGEKIDAGGALKLYLSKGPERFVIPAVQGLTADAAKAMLTKIHLSVAPLVEVYDATIPKGYVMSSSPASGSKVKRGTSVTLTVSKGIEQVVLPSYVGKSSDQALNELQAAGFKVTSTYAFSEKILAGLVVSQNPAASAGVNKGTSVSIVISKGSEWAYIPNVYALEETKAVRALEDLGFKVVVKRIGTKKIKKVTSISPKIGSKVKHGSTVTITVS